MESKTYDEWKKDGFGIIRGEKHSGRNEYGECTFTRDQVMDLKQEFIEKWAPAWMMDGIYDEMDADWSPLDTDRF